MNDPGIEYVLLYRTPREWRISVKEPDGIGCGNLPDTPPDAPIEVAQADLLQHLRRHWNFNGQLTWRQTKPDWWAANVHPPTRNPKIV